MRAWDLETSEAQLRDAFDELQTAWQEASESWNDPVSHKFREDHLEPIGPSMKLALDAVSRMEHMLARMHTDCES